MIHCSQKVYDAVFFCCINGYFTAILYLYFYIHILFLFYPLKKYFEYFQLKILAGGTINQQEASIHPRLSTLLNNRRRTERKYIEGGGCIALAIIISCKVKLNKE